MISNVWNKDRTRLHWAFPTKEVADIKFKYDKDKLVKVVRI